MDLERLVGDIGPITEQLGKDFDLGLTHRLDHVRFGVARLVAGNAKLVDGAAKGTENQSPVIDGGARHVKADQLDGHRKLSSAIAGAKVIPRPPAPVMAVTPRATSRR